MTRHDDAIAQLVEVTARNSESINRMQDAITNLTNTVANNNTRITTKTLQKIFWIILFKPERFLEPQFSPYTYLDA